jgi:hypothetical protein
MWRTGPVEEESMRTVGLAVLIAVAAGAMTAWAAEPAEDKPAWAGAVGEERFAPIAWLEGEWRGYGEFPDRVNYIHKTYEYDVAGMYLVERTDSRSSSR